MTTYSHRDHRVYREVYRLLGTIAGATSALVVLGVLAPWPYLGGLAVLGLALVGGAAVLESGAIIAAYTGDLRQVARGDTVPPVLRVEVESRIELERPLFVGARPSPNLRRPRGGRPKDGAVIGSAARSP